MKNNFKLNFEDKLINCQVEVFNEPPNSYDFKYNEHYFIFKFDYPHGGEIYTFYKETRDYLNVIAVKTWENEGIQFIGA